MSLIWIFFSHLIVYFIIYNLYYAINHKIINTLFNINTLPIKTIAITLMCDNEFPLKNDKFKIKFYKLTRCQKILRKYIIYYINTI